MLPEIGLGLPETGEKPLKAGQEVILSDATIAFKTGNIENHDQAEDYLDLLAEVYLNIPRPDTHYLHWPEILDKGLKDLIENPGCWSMVGGNSYLNAYVSDYETAPEIMVQLAILLPLVDYSKWSGKSLEVMDTIKKGLPAFYSEKLRTLVRWHPDAEDKLQGDEEQKMPMVMDSWYLHHPLLNLSRLAIDGDKTAEKLFLDSLGFAIKVARRFKYQWPVFYKMDTLEVIKAETKPGEGGEQDVAGLYAHVMLQAYELTGEKKYLQEAETAAKKLVNVGYKIMYQANNTAFAAGALLRLFKLTGNELYLSLSYRCLASIFENVQLWDCNYGYGKNLPTFFALFPLTDAPYTAAYEEQEVFCALHDYLKHAEGVDILPSVRLLCSEFIRYLVERAPYYYPPMLPSDMLSDEVKTGEVDRKLWIALEDLHDGIEKSGAVGQEVYGAGNAFGILPRHFIRFNDNPFLIFSDCPISGIRKSPDSVIFHLQGDPRLAYRLRITPAESVGKIPNIKFFCQSPSVRLTTSKDRNQDLEALYWEMKPYASPGKSTNSNKQFNNSIMNITQEIKRRRQYLHFKKEQGTNIEKNERLVSVLAGLYLLKKEITGISRHPILGIQSVAHGSFLLYRGASENCPAYRHIGKEVIAPKAITIIEKVTVQAPRGKVYAFWRDLSNLPLFMEHLLSVPQTSDIHSTWTAKVPGGITEVKWDAEIIQELPGSHIGWQSVPGSMISNAGKVGFRDSINGNATELTIEISYFPHMGSLGRGIARLFTPLFENTIKKDILGFRAYAESGYLSDTA